MSNRQNYTTLSIYPRIADRVIDLKKALSLRNNSEVVQVLFAAYDIVNATGYGGAFTEAVKRVLEEDKA